MGRIKELRKKQEEGTITPEEKEELEELEEEAKEGSDKVEEDGEDKEMQELVKKFMRLVDNEMDRKMEVVKDTKKGKIYTGIYTPEQVEAMDKDTRILEFVKALISGSHEKIQPLSEGTVGLGGYLVPEVWADTIVENILDMTVIRPRATVLKINTNKLNLPTLQARPKVYWRGELAAKTTTTAQWSEIELTPYSLAAIIPISQELEQDATVGVGAGGIVNYLTKLLAQAIAQEEDRAFVNGSGSGQPTGITTYTFQHTIDAGGALTGDHLIRAFGNLPQGYRNRAVWLMNSRTITACRQLKDSQNRYLMQDLAGTPTSTILGRPILEQNDLLSSQIYVGDLSYYYIVDRQLLTMETSREATVASYSAFERDLVHIKCVERVDGELALTDAFSQITNTGIS